MANVRLFIRDATVEVFARIVKAEAAKYGCDMRVEYDEGENFVRFLGDTECVPHIVEDVKKIFGGDFVEKIERDE